MTEFQPLPHEWMIISIIGFFVSWLYIYPYWSIPWGGTFMLFFILVFIATVINMSQATLQDDHLEELAIHELRRKR